MAFSVLLLHKKAAIGSKRLNAIYILLFLFVFTFTILNFARTGGGTVKWHNKPQLSFEFSKDSIPNAVHYNREADPLWALHSEDWSEHSIPNTKWWPFTKLYERCSAHFVTITDCAGGPHFNACVDLFESAKHKSPFDIEVVLKKQFTTMGPNATLPGLDPRPLTSDELMVDTHLNVFTQAYFINISYTYALDGAPSSFFGINSNVHPFGSNRDTRTILLGSDGLPKQTFQPGDAIVISLPKLLQLARGKVISSAAEVPTMHSYGNSMGSLELLPSWVWEHGCLLHVFIHCFSSDRDVRRTAGIRAIEGHDAAMWKLDASADKPICLLDVKLADSKSYHWISKVQQPGITVRERIVTLRVIGLMGHSYFRAMSANAVIAFITSSLVLLALPRKIMGTIVLNCLGRLSTIYRNILIQEVDIRECCVKAVLQLVSQSVCFVELADRLGPDGQAYGGISRSRIMERVQAVVRHRSEVLDRDEVETLAGFTFSLATCPPAQQMEGSLMLLKRVLASKKGARSSEQDCARSSEQDELPSIDIDKFCWATGSSYLSIDAIVQLFDRDRHIGIRERIFMPPDLLRCIHGSQQPPLPNGEEESGAESSAESMQARTSLERTKSNVESLLIAHELSQVGDDRQAVSTQTPRLMGMLQSVGNMSEQLDIMRANLEDLKLQLRKERELRSFSESALRQELSRALQANADEFDIKMVRIGNADFEHKDVLSQMRMELNTAAPDSCSTKDLVNLRKDLEALRHDLSSHSAQTKQQIIVEVRKAVQELLKVHGQSHHQCATSGKLPASEISGQDRPEKLMASDLTGKERCRSLDVEPCRDHCSVVEPDTYGRTIKAVQADAKHKVPVAATVNQTGMHQDLAASRASNDLLVAHSQDARSCMRVWPTLGGANECMDSCVPTSTLQWAKV